MKNSHHLFRALTLGLGLALLMATGTAAMIGVFSGPAPQLRSYSPVSMVPVDVPASQQAGDDTVLYQRVARSSGGYEWVLTQEPDATVAKREARENLASSAVPAATGGVQNVSYALFAKPAGLNKPIKNCRISRAGTKSKAADAYDISCNTLS